MAYNYFVAYDLHAIRVAMDRDDRLAVIWAHDAFISNYPTDVLAVLRGAFQSAA